MADHKYRVIKRLEAGGMAEVYLGEASSVEGFKKRVAIKRVLPHLAQNENFIQMFLDEARLSARLTHANIVSVFDISAREDTFFLIMEFIDGANLKKILDTLSKRGQRFPLPEAIYMCTEACRGLAYAHELHDENGHPLGIVHRDISPPNIMITRRGEVKVADFGLAKAGTQISQTDPGVVKGKFSYLSPEAANGKQVDARADIFSLGIVLWEMLAGRRLFLGETDYATVKLIQQANIPRLSPLNPQVDESFEEILLKALTREPEARYQSAEEFGDALTGYLFSRQLKVTNYDIAALVNAAMAEETGPTKNDASLIDRLIQDELDESVGVRSAAQELPPSDSGPQAVGLEGMEDPASWFNEHGASTAAAETSADRKSSGSGAARVNPGSGATRAGAGWRESGVGHAPIKLDEPKTKASSKPAEARDERTTLELDELEAEPLLSVPAPPPTPMPPAAALAGKAKGGTGKYVVMAILAVAALIIALFGRRL
ncbi:MAG TPA: serine/threonine-protein kinase [Polyangiales bacterium]